MTSSSSSPKARTLVPNDPVLVIAAPGLPFGARVLGYHPSDRGKDPMVWLDVCHLGQHLPQMYPESAITVITAQTAPACGLCPACLGWGDTVGPPPGDLAALARGIAEIATPCTSCFGTGRPSLRAFAVDAPNGGGKVIELRILPHSFLSAPVDKFYSDEMRALFDVPPGPDGLCLACGMPKDAEFPRGTVIHP